MKRILQMYGVLAIVLAGVVLADSFCNLSSGSGGGTGTATNIVRQAVGVSATTATLPISPVSGSYIFVAVGSSTMTYPTISDGTNTYTELVKANTASNALIIYNAPNTATSSLTITETGATNPNICAMEVILPSSFGNNVDVTGTFNGTSGYNNGVSLALTKADLVVAAQSITDNGVNTQILLPIVPVVAAFTTDSCGLGYTQSSAAMTIFAGFQQSAQETNTIVAAVGMN